MEGKAWEILIEAVGASEEVLDQEKCTKLFVQSANKNVKFHSNRRKVSLFIAEIVMLRKEDTKVILYLLTSLI